GRARRSWERIFRRAKKPDPKKKRRAHLFLNNERTNDRKLAVFHCSSEGGGPPPPPPPSIQPGAMERVAREEMTPAVGSWFGGQEAWLQPQQACTSCSTRQQPKDAAGEEREGTMMRKRSRGVPCEVGEGRSRRRRR
ncbi:unnamed protein product, partial [Scytosiphon promiscuus]